MNINLVNFLLGLFAVIGFLLSVYAYNVELSFEEDNSYVAMCDISEHMSCTKAFSSEYGKGFGLTRLIFGEDSALNLPNGALGLIFYSVFGLLCFSTSSLSSKIMTSMAIASNLVSLYLAYVLYFVLYDACVVCISLYFVNAILLWLSLTRQSIVAGYNKKLPKMKQK